MTRTVAALAVLSLFQAQAAQDWSNLTGLAKGSALEVRREDDQSFRGTLASISENQLVLDTSSGSQSFGRSTIRTVKIKSSGRRTRNAAIGAAIGAAIAGGAVAAGMSLICASCWGERNNWGASVAAYTAIAAGGGALVGWLIPGYKTIYKAPKSPRRPAGKK
jgi:hypothetical protein